MSGFNVICCVVNMGSAPKTLKIAKKYGIQGDTISIGRGIVNNRFFNALAINEDRKEIITMVVESELASEAIQGISSEMHFEKHHHGIAFSYPVSEFIGRKNVIDSTRKLPQKGTKERKTMYNVIFAIVDKGKAEEVIDAAGKAGSRGGTIINARGSGVHEVQKFFSVEIEPEKEEVFIVTKRENKDKIVASVVQSLKIDEPGNGILYVLDVNEAYGLF